MQRSTIVKFSRFAAAGIYNDNRNFLESLLGRKIDIMKNLLDDRLIVVVGGSLVAVEDPGPGVDPEVDEQRPGVLGQEDGGPSDLVAAVLEVEHGPVLDAEFLEGGVILESLALGFEPQLLPIDVSKLELLPGDVVLQVLDGVAARQLKNFNEIFIK